MYYGLECEQAFDGAPGTSSQHDGALAQTPENPFREIEKTMVAHALGQQREMENRYEA